MLWVHKLLDLLQVLRGEGPGHIEVVVEAVLSGGTDSDLGVRKNLKHSLGHHMGRRMAHAMTEGLLRGNNAGLEGAVVKHCLTFGAFLELRRIPIHYNRCAQVQGTEIVVW